MTSPRRVFCKDCRHIQRAVLFDMSGRYEWPANQCQADKGIDPVDGNEIVLGVEARERNANFDCTKFTPWTDIAVRIAERIVDEFPDMDPAAMLTLRSGRLAAWRAHATRGTYQKGAV